MRQDRDDVRNVQERIEFLRKAADRSEVLTEGVKGPFWKDYLLPVLDHSIEAFSSGVWTMDAKEFESRRAAAGALLDFKEFVLARVGTRDEVLARASALADALDRAVKEGRIPADWLEEGAQ